MRIQASRRTCRGSDRQNLIPRKELTPPQNDYDKSRRLGSSPQIGGTALQSLGEQARNRNRTAFHETPSPITPAMQAAQRSHEIDEAYRQEMAVRVEAETFDQLES